MKIDVYFNKIKHSNQRKWALKSTRMNTTKKNENIVEYF